MKWRPLEEALLSFALMPEHTFHKLRLEEVEEFTRNLRNWYPDIRVGSESRFLDPHFYYENIFVGRDRNSDDSDFYPVVCRTNGEISGWLILEKNDQALTISSPMAGIVPSFRLSGAGRYFSAFLEHMGRLIHAEMAFAIVTLKMQGSQRIIESHGFQLVGILPAFDRDMVEPGKVKRVFEAVYAKVLVGDEKIVYPSEECLTPQTRELFEFLFKREGVGNESGDSVAAPMAADGG